MKLKSALFGLAVTALFSLLFLLGVFGHLENQAYDFLLRFRQDRQLSEDVVFLDIDDTAITYYGTYPWPRSIYAEGFLRLKEHGARAAIFDIEFIDRGPLGVDSEYLEQRLPVDFSRSFTGINEDVNDIFSALSA